MGVCRLLFQYNTSFCSIKNTIIDSEHNGSGTDLWDILETIDKQQFVDPLTLQEHFWNVFVVDAFLGNFDRHNGNWGILVDEENQTAEIAPVYDCGSCLYPQLAAEDMKSVLEDENQINKRIFTFPTSAVEEEEKKISYFEFISSLKNEDCNEALKRIYKRIDLEKINRLIEETPFIEPVQKDFYQVMLKERKEKILDYSMKLLLVQEKQMGQEEEASPIQSM